MSFTLSSTVDTMDTGEIKELPPCRPRRKTRKERYESPKNPRAINKANANDSEKHERSSIPSSGHDAVEDLLMPVSFLAALKGSSSAEGVGRQMISDFRRKTARDSPDEVPLMKSTPVKSFHSAAANKTQLKAVFGHVYYPTCMMTSFCPSRWLLFHAKATPRVHLAEHALHLTQLGTMSADPAAIHEALRVYHAVLIQLRTIMLAPRARPDDGTLVIAHLLSLCETYVNISGDDTGRKNHLSGIGKLLEARGPASLSSYSSKISLQMYWQSTLCDSLLTRKQNTACQSEWIAVLSSQDSCKWKIPQMTSFLLQIPALLEEVDILCSQDQDVPIEIVLNTMAKLKDFKTDLRNWMKDWYVRSASLPYQIVPVESCPQVESFTGKGAPAFESALDFPGTASAKAHEMYWMALLALDEAGRDLALLSPYSRRLGVSPADQVEYSVTECDECADNLCMSAMYMVKPEHGVDGYVDACQSIRFAATWYRKSRNFGKLKWCKSFLDGIARKGIRVPPVDIES